MAGHSVGASIQNSGQSPIGLGCLIDAVIIISPSVGDANALLLLRRADV